jgi:hypothetical protein
MRAGGPVSGPPAVAVPGGAVAPVLPNPGGRSGARSDIPRFASTCSFSDVVVAAAAGASTLLHETVKSGEST